MLKNLSLKLMLLFAITSFLTSHVNADGLPALPDMQQIPVPEVVEEQESDKESDKSWWQSFLSFFGFGDDEIAVAENAPAPAPTNSSDFAPVEQSVVDIPDFNDIKKAEITDEEDGPTDQIIAQDEQAADEYSQDLSGDEGDFTLTKEDQEEPIVPKDILEEDALANIPTRQQEVEASDVFAEFADEAGLSEEQQSDMARKMADADMSAPPVTDVPDVVESNYGDKPTVDIAALPDIPNAADVELPEPVQDLDIPKVPDNFTAALPPATDVPVVPDMSGDILAEMPIADSDVSDITPLATDNSRNIGLNAQVDKFREQIQKNRTADESLPLVPGAQVNFLNSTDDSSLSQELDNKQLKFVNDEAKVLALANDDIVLGELSEEAKLKLIDFNTYQKLFWKNYDWIQNTEKRREIERFIVQYDDNYNTERFLFADENDYDGLANAAKSIDRFNYNDLKVMLDNYAILQLKIKGDNTLLHRAAYNGNYPAAKLLLMRGIDMNAVNARRQNAAMVAERYNRQHIVFLLHEAGLK